jgi:LPS O-antigen subunit length determinant protein (WzzB/FepE family)
MEGNDNLLGVLASIFKWKKFILFTTGITAIGAVVIALLLPVYYTATTVFYAASPDLAIPENLFGNSNEAPEYYGNENDRDRLISISNSGELSKFMIDSFNLYEHYNVDSTSPKGRHNIRLKFSKHFSVVKTKYDELEISVEDRNPKKAADMANAAREFINSFSKKLIKESQKKILATYDDNILNSELSLQQLNDSLLLIRQRFGVYNPSAQGEILAEMIAKTEANLNNAIAKLEVLESLKYRRDTISMIKANIKGYEGELRNLQAKLDTFRLGLNQAEILKSRQNDAGSKLSWDKLRHAQTKASFESDFPVTHLLEAATVPAVKSRPKRSLIVVVATAIAFIFSVLGVVVFDSYKEINWREILQS